MSKPLVFISHITEERELAIYFKELIELSFLGMIEVFVSSDDHSISLGQKWLDNITDSLKTCSIEIILCSPKSIKRPWINFEAGAGWIRDIPVIPLCHSGMQPSHLPIPLNLLQAAKVSEVSSLKLLFPVLAQAIGAKTPQIDFTKFISNVKDFELKYTFWDECNNAFGKVHSFNPQLISNLKSGNRIRIDLKETDINYFETFMPFFTENNILDLRRIGNTSFTTAGVFFDFEINILEKFSEIVKNENFKY